METNNVEKPRSDNRIQYPYALNENNVLTFIGDIDKETRRTHTYICPYCGANMIPRMGEHNAHYFAHDGKACGTESYIHKVAKEILANRFNNSDTFFVSFSTDRICNQAHSCRHFEKNTCSFSETVEYDLKKYFDLQAEKEFSIQNGDKIYRPDVALLSSDKSRLPIFLEVFFKHKSSELKITNNRCIEIRITDFHDLNKLETEPLVESDKIKFHHFKETSVTPEKIDQFARTHYFNYDLLSPECVLPFCKQSKGFQRMNSKIRRFTLKKNGETFDTGILEEEMEVHDPLALADLTYKAEAYNFDPSYILALKDQRFRTCNLCEHVAFWYNEAAWCNLAKNGSRQKGTFKPLKGSFCEQFEWRQRLDFHNYKIMPEKNVEGRDYTIWIAEK